MKQIISYLQQFVRRDFHAAIYGFTLLFVGIAITLNYTFQFEDEILDPLQSHWWAFFLYFFYFTIPYLFVILLYSIFIPREVVFSNRFWFKLLFALGLLAAKVWFNFHRHLAPNLSFQETYVFYKISTRVVNVSFYTIGLLFFYKFLEIENKNRYGLTTKEFHWTPYLLLLLCMVPLIFWASFQPDFLNSYPRLHPSVLTTHYWEWFSVFEPLYMLEFLTLEWFFRGFLVVGMVKLIGHRAVLPMAVMYCVFHFGKPIGECIGSLFGGYILGVISYYTRSVWGGVIVHMGIALLMDLFALLSLNIWQTL